MSRFQIPNRAALSFVLLGILALLSCGLIGCGGDPAPAPAPISVVAPEPQKQRGPAPKPPPPPPPPPSPLAGADPADIFDEGEPPPNYEILGRAPEFDPRDEFVAVTPMNGADSSRFEVLLGGPIATRDSPNALAKLPAGFRPVERTGYSTDGWPLRIVCERDVSEMVLIPAGSIQLGSEAGSPEIRPAVPIDVSAYYIDVAEVTVGQFQSYRSVLGPRVAAPLNANDGVRRPALGINWSDARDYARWVGKELPTEAEWERAARGPKHWRTPWGDGQALWERARAPEQIDDVKSFLHDCSRFGVFDVAGNAREWCADFYSSKAHSEAIAALPARRQDWPGPRQPSRPNQRVVKGGSSDWSLWHRAGMSMSERAADVGFRCVLRLRSEDNKAKP